MESDKPLLKLNTSTRSRKLWTVVAMLIIAVIPIVLIIAFHQQIANLGWQSYLGLFLLSLVSASGTVTAGVPIAVPGLLITYLAGGMLNPLWVGLVGGVGAGLGECFSYPVGVAGRVLFKKGKTIDWLKRLMKRFGGWVIIVGAVIPNPAFDFVGLAAGLSGYPFSRFIILVIAGRILRAMAASYLGYYLSHC